MIKYVKYQNKNEDSKAYGKWYARIQNGETLDVGGLAEHMASHNSCFSAGVIKGLLTDAVACIRELILEGKKVKIEDLGLFYPTISCVGADTPEKFSVQKNIKGIRMRVRGSGSFSSATLKSKARYQEADEYVSPLDDEEVGDIENP